MSTEEMRELVRRFAEVAWSTGDASILDELCTPDYQVHDLINGWVGSLEDQKNNLLHAYEEDPNGTCTVSNVIVEGDRVAYQFTMEGISEGKLARFTGITMLKLRDGKIYDDRYVAAMEKMPEEQQATGAESAPAAM